MSGGGEMPHGVTMGGMPSRSIGAGAGGSRRGEARWTGSLSKGSKRSIRMLQSLHGGSKLAEDFGSTRMQFDAQLGRMTAIEGGKTTKKKKKADKREHRSKSRGRSKS